MTIEGRIAIDIGVTDAHTTNGVQSVQRITLADTFSSTALVAAVFTGTASTAATIFYPLSPTGYRDASGGVVTFASVSYAAVCGSEVLLEGGSEEGPPDVRLHSVGKTAVTRMPVTVEEFRIKAQVTTTNYTLILYGVAAS